MNDDTIHALSKNRWNSSEPSGISKSFGLCGLLSFKPFIDHQIDTCPIAKRSIKNKSTFEQPVFARPFVRHLSTAFFHKSEQCKNRGVGFANEIKVRTDNGVGIRLADGKTA